MQESYSFLINKEFKRNKAKLLSKMLLEMVESHPTRKDIFIDKIITAHEQVKKSDKIIIKRILLKEVARFDFIKNIS